MIPFSEIEKFSARWRVSPATVEKDYCLTWVLLGIVNLEDPMPLVFYGGTAIKKIYIPDYRFSEDLDFIITSPVCFDEDTIAEKLRPALHWAADESGIHFTINDGQAVMAKDRFQYFIGYDGFSDIRVPIKRIKLDFLCDNDRYIDSDCLRIKRVYSDFPDTENSVLRVYTREAILADKFSAVLDAARNEPRDIYDIWQLLRLKELDHHKVREIFRKKSGFYPTPAVLKTHVTNRFYEARWKARLDHQVVDLPKISLVIEEIFLRLGRLPYSEISL